MGVLPLNASFGRQPETRPRNSRFQPLAERLRARRLPYSVTSGPYDVRVASCSRQCHE
jgi:hypothetical protein